MLGILRSVFEMLPDVAGILLAALSLSLIFLPKELKMLEGEKWRWLRWTLAAIFAVIGIGGLASNALQKSQDKAIKEKLQGDVARLRDDVANVQKKLNENTNASVGLYGLVPQGGGQELTPQRDIRFNIGYAVMTNNAKNMRAYQEVLTVPGLFTPDQSRNVHAGFAARAAKGLDFRGEDRRAGMGSFRTLQLRLTSKEISEVMLAKRIIYILGRVEWNNPSGTDDHFDVCKAMEPPSIKYLTDQNTAWHDCPL
jgi:hypothetical protein